MDHIDTLFLKRFCNILNKEIKKMNFVYFDYKIFKAIIQIFSRISEEIVKIRNGNAVTN